jgi:hypothetical protein
LSLWINQSFHIFRIKSLDLELVDRLVPVDSTSKVLQLTVVYLQPRFKKIVNIIKLLIEFLAPLSRTMVFTSLDLAFETGYFSFYFHIFFVA